jgi:hypothetical protein
MADLVRRDPRLPVRFSFFNLDYFSSDVGLLEFESFQWSRWFPVQVEAKFY